MKLIKPLRTGMLTLMLALMLAVPAFAESGPVTVYPSEVSYLDTGLVRIEDESVPLAALPDTSRDDLQVTLLCGAAVLTMGALVVLTSRKARSY